MRSNTNLGINKTLFVTKSTYILSNSKNKCYKRVQIGERVIKREIELGAKNRGGIR